VRTDIWAVGAILYRALGGKTAFSGPTVGARLMAVSHDEPEPLEELAPELPADLVAVVKRCLDKNPEARFQTVAELSKALEPFAAPGPVPVVPIKVRAEVDEDSETLVAVDPADVPTVAVSGEAVPSAAAPVKLLPLLAGGGVVVLLVAAGLWLSGDPEDPQPEDAAISTSGAEEPVAVEPPGPTSDRPDRPRSRRGGKPRAPRKPGDPLPSLDDETWQDSADTDGIEGDASSGGAAPEPTDPDEVEPGPAPAAPGEESAPTPSPDPTPSGPVPSGPAPSGSDDPPAEPG
jgi:serine/threonine-protein kinase